MTKEEEIKHLMALMGKGCGDTYFNQFFSICDIEKMIENIKSDFAIECGCTFNKEAEVLEQQLHAEQKAHDQDVLDFVESMTTKETTHWMLQPRKSGWSIPSKLSAITRLRSAKRR